ncbi:MAG: helix-turn-helix transcriptional regulator [Rhodospirillales bacterium]|nr:MAG: helix-turn-helix transcriptional regulator [Rhodospirillales bacterium]
MSGPRVTGPDARAAEGIRVGQQIRDLRKAKGLTIAALAGRIDRSVGYVSQIERNLSELSIPDLKRVAEALEVQISWFFHPTAAVPPAERDYIVRRGNRRRLSLTGIGVTEELLSPSLGGASELVLTRIPPHSTTGEEFVTRKAEESGLVLQGRMGLWVKDRYFLLEEGDSFCLRPEESHRVANPGDVECVVVWVITPPVY